MTIGDRIPATRRPGEKQPPEQPTPNRVQHTPDTPEHPTPTGMDQRAETRLPRLRDCCLPCDHLLASG